MNIRTLVRLAAGFLLVLIAGAIDARAQRDVAPPPRPIGPAPAPLPRPVPPHDPSLPAGAVARIGQPRLRHPGAAINVAFAPTGMTFVSTGYAAPKSADTSQLAVLWDAETGRELKHFKGHTGAVDALAYSADGKYLATGGFDRTVRLWDVESGTEVRQFKGHTERVLAVALSPDGKRLASESPDATVRVWDAGTAKELYRLPGHKSQGTSNVRYSPDGKLLATVTEDFAVRLSDPETGNEIRSLTGPTKDCFSLDFTADGKRLAAIEESGVVWVWDAATGKETLRFQAHQGMGTCVRVSPDGSILATGSNDTTIRLWTAAGKPIRTLTGHTGNVSELSFSADGSVIASAGHEGAVKLWDAATGRELPQSGGVVRRVALSPDGKQLATVGFGPGVRFWDAETGRALPGELPANPSPRAIGFTADGRNLLAATSTGVRVWDLDARRAREHPAGAAAQRLAAGPGGRLVVASADGSLAVWDVSGGSPPAEARGAVAGAERLAPLVAAEVGPGDRLAVSGRDGKLRAWELTTGQQVFAASVPPGEATFSLAWSPDGRVIASAGRGPLRIWEAASGWERRVTPWNAEVWSVAFSPDGRLLAAGGGRGDVRLYDVRTGEELASRVGHQGNVTFVAFTRDGRFLVTAGAELTFSVGKGQSSTVSGDSTAMVWSVAALVKEVPPVPKVGPADEAWAALGGADAGKAGDAVWRLAADPDLAVPLLKERLPKVAVGSPGGFDKPIADLDDDDFDVREKATADLIRAGAAAKAAVRAALANTKSREVRRRAEEVLAKLGEGTAPTAGELHLMRGVEILQRIGTAEARQLLEAWADGPGGSALTREARTSLRLTGK